MTAAERRASVSLAAIYALRMLGLFLVVPVMALYAENLSGVTPLLVGVAIGAYGLSQAILQLPLGMLSDRIGRKPVIVGGLLVFALGSAVAAMSDSIWGVILGRALQGSGAISAAVMALAADLTREEHRTKAMAMIGMSIGASFMLAIVGGPVLGEWIGVPGIFWLTALLALAGAVVTVYVVPNPRGLQVHRDAEPVPGQFGRVLAERNLLRLNFGILVLHMTISSVFLAVPLALRDMAGMATVDHWKFYLPVMVVSVVTMVPFIIHAEKRRRLKPVFLGAILALALAQCGVYFLHDSLPELALALVMFFTAFNLLEAMLPSLISRVAPADAKGTAMGVYSTSQFIGAFLGGVLGGWVHGQFELSGVFILGAGSSALWLLVAWGMAPPRHLKNQLLRVGRLDDAQAQLLAARLAAVAGVVEAVVVAAEGVAYLKVDPDLLADGVLDEFSVAGA